MTLFKSMWRAVVLMGIAGVLGFVQADVTVSGTITSGAGPTSSPVAGASVQLKDASGTVGDPVVTGTDGTYEIEDVVAGTYTIEVSKSGFTTGTIASFTVAAVDVTGKDLVLVASPDAPDPGTDSLITISVHPQNKLDYLTHGIGGGASNRLTVTATLALGALTDSAANASLRYQWFKASSTTKNPLSDVSQGAPSALNYLQIDTGLTAGPHYYYCRVTSALFSDSKNTEKAQTSNVATVTVTNAVAFVFTGPQASTTIAQTAGTSLSVSVTTPGSGVHYQWKVSKSNSNAEGDNVGTDAATYTITAGALAPGWYYYYCVLSAEGSFDTRTDVAVVQVNPTGKTILPEATVFGFKDTEVEYSLTTTKNKITYPTQQSGYATGPATSGSFYVTKIVYTKVGHSNGSTDEYDGTAGLANKEYMTATASANADDKGVDSAGVYSVVVTVENTGSSGERFVGSKTVTLTVKPRPLSTSGIALTATTATFEYNAGIRDPKVVLKDGSGASAKTLIENTGSLEHGIGDFVVRNKNVGWTNAGTITVWVDGEGNYIGEKSVTFTITKRALSVDVNGTTVTGSKTYDGRDTLAAGRINVKFNGLAGTDVLTRDVDFTISGQTLSSPNVGSRTLSGITVKLDTAASVLARNYTFGAASPGPLAATFSKTGVSVVRATPVANNLSFEIPLFHVETGSPRGIGAVAWKSPLTNPNGTLKVSYRLAGDYATYNAPSSGGPYAVTVEVKGGDNFDDAAEIALGEYSIAAPKPPVVDSLISIIGGDSTVIKSTYNVTAYRGDPLVMVVKATKPELDSVTIKKKDGVTDSITLPYKGGTLTYQWFKANAVDPTKWDTIKTGGTSATLNVSAFSAVTASGAPIAYKAEVTYTYNAVQTVQKASINVDVTVEADRVDLSDAVITVPNAPYTYTGIAIAVADVTVSLGGSNLDPATDYKISYFGTNAGTGTVTVTGKNGYKGNAVEYFVINKKELVTDGTEADVRFSSNVQYNGEVQPFTVTLKSPFKGMGTPVIKYLVGTEAGDDITYAPLASAPKNAGKYLVKVKIPAGDNFLEVEDTLELPYNINKRIVTKADFTYSALPVDHGYTGVADRAVTASLTKPMGYTGTLSVVYGDNELAAVPTEEGTYKVYVIVSGDANHAANAVELGSWTIHEEGWVGVKGSDRVVPKQIIVSEAAVAPIKAVAASFTAGPSPVKVGGEIKFFSKTAVKSGNLYIFDANGNSVAKRAAKSGTGEIGSWNLTSKGNAVSEGTYVVKGALVGKDGTREKVSFVFSVVR